MAIGREVRPPRYEATATVLESRSHGPQLCLGGVALSHPPKCGGPEIVGWDWDAAPAKEQAAGTTWGWYTVVGTWDGVRFTLVEPPRPPRARPRTSAEITTPCPTPADGWRPADPTNTTDEALDEVFRAAKAEPDFAGSWVDWRSIDPALYRRLRDGHAGRDPTKVIANFSFTGDLARHEVELRQIWGGAMCVSHARRTHAELSRIGKELSAERRPDWLGTGLSTVRNIVEYGVIVDDGTLQQALDERYGDGAVAVLSALTRIDA